MTAPAQRLERLARGVSSATPHAGLSLAAPGDDGDWWSLEAAIDPLAAWHTALTATTGDRRAAASYLGAWLTQAPSVVVGLPAILADVLVHAEPGAIWMRRHPDGWFDHHAVDPADVSDGPEVLAQAGVHVARLASPVVEAVVQALPVGRPAVWGSLADAMCGAALQMAPVAGLGARQAWDRAHRLLDVVQDHAPLRVRPTPFEVAWSGGESMFQVRGTCCLHHRTCADVDPDAEGYCTTCPLRSDASRTARLVAHLEATAGRR